MKRPTTKAEVSRFTTESNIFAQIEQVDVADIKESRARRAFKMLGKYHDLDLQTIADESRDLAPFAAWVRKTLRACDEAAKQKEEAAAAVRAKATPKKTKGKSKSKAKADNGNTTTTTTTSSSSSSNANKKSSSTPKKTKKKRPPKLDIESDSSQSSSSSPRRPKSSKSARSARSSTSTPPPVDSTFSTPKGGVSWGKATTGRSGSESGASPSKRPNTSAGARKPKGKKNKNSDQDDEQRNQDQIAIANANIRPKTSDGRTRRKRKPKKNKKQTLPPPGEKFSQMTNEELYDAYLELDSALTSAINKNHVQELKQYKSPPPVVQSVIQAAMILLGKSTEWSEIIRELKRDVLKQMQDLDVTSITNKQIVKVQPIAEDPVNTPAKVRSMSNAASALLRWVQAVYNSSLVAKEAKTREDFEEYVEQREKEQQQKEQEEKEAQNDEHSATQQELQEQMESWEQDAIAVLDAIKESQLRDLFAMPRPPILVTFVVEATLILMKKQPKWSLAVDLMEDENYLDQLKAVDLNQISKSTVSKVEPYVNDPSFNTSSLNAVSDAAAYLCQWVLSCIEHRRLAKKQQEQHQQGSSSSDSGEQSHGQQSGRPATSKSTRGGKAKSPHKKTYAEIKFEHMVSIYSNPFPKSPRGGAKHHGKPKSPKKEQQGEPSPRRPASSASQGMDQLSDTSSDDE
eukprot:TRINITY_DN6590_c0_g3_i1.p1 TRINITY_DN6590_c0_g3~~TRINITY_DN6590_c0_g3_i1.p1  ORF type:complete len:686 (-),score=263.51 TRINITY_DN6590_c0_g3_i1:740-2797(-)